MPIIPPPPRPPKRLTVTVRLELDMLNELRRYATCLNSDNSYVVAYALKELFADGDWKKWLNAHPDIHPQMKGRRKSSQSRASDQTPSGSTSMSSGTTADHNIGPRNSIGGA